MPRLRLLLTAMEVLSTSCTVHRRQAILSTSTCKRIWGSLCVITSYRSATQFIWTTPLQTASKRKSSVVDSEDEEEQLKPRLRRRSASASSSLPGSDEERSSPGPGRAKKQRVSLLESDEDEDTAAASAMTKRLSRFKKPATPKKPRMSTGSRDGDSDFIPEVEEFSDVDVVPPTSSRRGSSVSHSELDLESASEMSDAPRKKAPAKKSGGRPALQKSQSSSGGGTSFLTAAEQREKDKKSEKKSNEDAFEFLKDVRDVSNIRYFTSICAYIGHCRKIRSVQVSRVTTRGRFTFRLRLGRHSRRLRLRFVCSFHACRSNLL